MPPPAAPRRPHVTQVHGERLNDPYHWLRDPGYPAVDNPEILAHLTAENRWFEGWMASRQPFVARIVAELEANVVRDDASVAVVEGPFAGLWRFAAGDEYRCWCRTPVAGGDEQLVLSEPALAAGHAYFRLAGIAYSPDGTLVAYATDTDGAERFTLKVRDIASGADIAVVTAHSVGVPVWTADSAALAWVEVDALWRRRRVRRYRLADGDDRVLYEEPDEGFGVSVGKSQDGRWLVLATNDHATSEVRLLPADDPDAAPLLVRARVPGVEYEIDVRDGTVFVRANDTHPNFRLAAAPVGRPGDWAELIAGDDAQYLRSVHAFTGYLAIEERIGGLDQVRLRFDDGRDERIAFPEASYTVSIGPNREPAAPLLRLNYSSLITPATVFDYDVAARTLITRKVQQVPSGYDANDYATARLTVPARDGAGVPVSVVWKKGYPRDGSGHLHLYGYGAYGIAIPPSFSANRRSLLDRGVAYAIAHIRGGDDLGHGWYLDGKAERRTNAFNDFVDAAHGLIAAGFAAPGGISASGGSAGGELMGVVLNTDPGLWRAVVADVPFVDVLNTMLDASLPLTPGEWPEWGNPIEDKAAFELIRGYCPYQNVRAQDYPPLLVTAGLNDPRVTYWEPAKWVAKLRAAKTDANPLLLKTNMGAGHGGVSGRFAALREVAEQFTFILSAARRNDEAGRLADE